MISAQEARLKLNESITSKVNITLLFIENKIKEAIANGKNYIVYETKTNKVETYDIIKKTLVNLGYKVTRQNGYDQRDNYSWDYLEISW